MSAVSTPSRNRRQATRKIPRQIVNIGCRRGAFGMGTNIAAAFLDISDGGVRLIVKEPLKLKQEVEIRLEAPTLGKPLIRVGRVVWSVPMEDGQFCLGVQFDKRIAFADVQKMARP